MAHSNGMTKEGFMNRLFIEVQARTGLACTPRAQDQLSAAPGMKYAALCFCKNKLIVSSREPAAQPVPMSDPQPHTTTLRTGPDRAGGVGATSPRLQDVVGASGSQPCAEWVPTNPTSSYLSRAAGLPCESLVWAR